VNNWNSVLELAADRSVVAGSREALRDAIGAGADLRIYTEFRYNEHIDPESDNSELVTEVSDFRVTYLVDEERWAAGIMSLRMPIQPPDGFGPRPSMSFFMYNENGEQAIARPHLDACPGTTNLIAGTQQPTHHHTTLSTISRAIGSLSVATGRRFSPTPLVVRSCPDHLRP